MQSIRLFFGEKGTYGYTLILDKCNTLFQYIIDCDTFDNIGIIERHIEAYPQDLNQKTIVDDTPLTLACKLTYLDDEMRMRIIELLLRKGANINATDLYGRTALHNAIIYLWNPIRESIIKILVTNEANIRIRDEKDNLTPLHLLVLRGTLTEIDIFLDSKPDVRLEDELVCDVIKYLQEQIRERDEGRDTIVMRLNKMKK